MRNTELAAIPVSHIWLTPGIRKSDFGDGEKRFDLRGWEKELHWIWRLSECCGQDKERRQGPQRMI